MELIQGKRDQLTQINAEILEIMLTEEPIEEELATKLQTCEEYSWKFLEI